MAIALREEKEKRRKASRYPHILNRRKKGRGEESAIAVRRRKGGIDRALCEGEGRSRIPTKRKKKQVKERAPAGFADWKKRRRA